MYMKLYPSHGYLRARFSAKGRKVFKFVHELVLEAFVGPRPRGCQCDHINGYREDNNVENLRWVTPWENIRNPITNARRRIPLRSIRCIETGQVFDSVSRAAQWAGVSTARVSAVARKKLYCKSAGGFHFEFV